MNVIHKVPLVWSVSAEVDNKSELECTLADVLIKPGQKVSKDYDALCVIETDKATDEMEAPVSGEVLEIFLEAGKTYHYGTIFCTIEEK